jgi:hypothetical protein
MAKVFDVCIIAATHNRRLVALIGIRWAFSFPHRTARVRSTRQSAYSRDDFEYFFANIFELFKTMIIHRQNFPL